MKIRSLKLKKIKYISLVTSALLAVSPVITTSLTTSSVVNAAKTTHAKKHVKKITKKRSKKAAKKSVKKSSKKAVKKTKNSAISKIFPEYNESDSVTKQYYRTAYNNRYGKKGHQYVDVKANTANTVAYDNDGTPSKYHLHNKAGEVYKISLEDFEIDFDPTELPVHLLSADGYTYYNAKDFTIVPHTDGTKKSLANMLATSD